MAEAIRYEVTGAVARITIDWPELGDAPGPDEWRALRDAIERASDDEIRVLALAIAGGTFPTGRKRSTNDEAMAPPARRDRLARDVQVLRDLRELAVPVIAVIDGHAMAAGLGLALACDLRVASSRSRFSAALHGGTVPGHLGGVALLAQAIGTQRALDLLLLTDEIDAAEALRIGLVHRVYQVDLFHERCEEIIERVAALPTAAVALTKRALHRAAHTELVAVIDDEAAAQALVGTTDDAAEGVRAFLEKRAPRFRGR